MSRYAVLPFLGLLGIATLSMSGAQAAIIYGINGPTNQVLAINTTTGNTSVAGGGYGISPDGSDSPNALGYDAANNRFYFTGGAANRNLYRAVPGTTTVTNLGSLGSSQVFSGTMIGTDYYFWTENGELRRVASANSVTNPVSSSAVLTSGIIPGSGDFGDIIANGNLLYASYGGDSNGNNARFSIIDLSTSSVVGTFTGSKRMQLAFAGGTLFGIQTGTDQIFSVNTANGAPTLVSTLTNGALFITDAATVPLPAAAWLFGSAFLGLCWLGRRAGTRGVGMLPAG